MTYNDKARALCKHLKQEDLENPHHAADLDHICAKLSEDPKYSFEDSTEQYWIDRMYPTLERKLRRN